MSVENYENELLKRIALAANREIAKKRCEFIKEYFNLSNEKLIKMVTQSPFLLSLTEDSIKNKVENYLYK